MNDALNAAVRIRQSAYLSDERKTAVLVAQGGDAASDAVVRRAADEYPMLLAPIGPAEIDPASGEMVRAIDFTPLREAGRYFIDVPGVGRSSVFEIGVQD